LFNNIFKEERDEGSVSNYSNQMESYVARWSTISISSAAFNFFVDSAVVLSGLALISIGFFVAWTGKIGKTLFNS
jgi:hypothetical protein